MNCRRPWLRLTVLLLVPWRLGLTWEPPNHIYNHKNVQVYLVQILKWKKALIDICPLNIYKVNICVGRDDLFLCLFIILCTVLYTHTHTAVCVDTVTSRSTSADKTYRYIHLRMSAPSAPFICGWVDQAVRHFSHRWSMMHLGLWKNVTGLNALICHETQAVALLTHTHTHTE